jgi:hypothetical protein
MYASNFLSLECEQKSLLTKFLLNVFQAQSMDAGDRLKDELQESKLTAKELQAAHDDLQTSLHALQV